MKDNTRKFEAGREDRMAEETRKKIGIQNQEKKRHNPKGNKIYIKEERIDRGKKIDRERKKRDSNCTWKVPSTRLGKGHSAIHEERPN